MLASSVPAPTCAINNEVAYVIMQGMRLEFDVRLTGLHGAAHFNGRGGVIRGPDPANNGCYEDRPDDGTYVSVRAANFVHVRRGEYKREHLELHCTRVMVLSRHKSRGVLFLYLYCCRRTHT